jgi:hypothetical protein
MLYMNKEIAILTDGTDALIRVQQSLIKGK